MYMTIEEEGVICANRGKAAKRNSPVITADKTARVVLKIETRISA